MAMIASQLSVSVRSKDGRRAWHGQKYVPASLGLDRELLRLVGLGMVMESNWDATVDNQVTVTLDTEIIFLGWIRP